MRERRRRAPAARARRRAASSSRRAWRACTTPSATEVRPQGRAYLGTDVIDEVEVAPPATIFSSAALRMASLKSRTRSAVAHLLVQRLVLLRELGEASPETRVLILVSAFVGFLEASSSFAFFGGEGGMADADLPNAERSASAVSASAGVQRDDRRAAQSTHSSHPRRDRSSAAKSSARKRACRQPRKFAGWSQGARTHVRHAERRASPARCSKSAAMERSAAWPRSAQPRRGDGGRARWRALVGRCEREASFWAEARRGPAVQRGAPVPLRALGRRCWRWQRGRHGARRAEPLRQPAQPTTACCRARGRRAGALQQRLQARGGCRRSCPASWTPAASLELADVAVGAARLVEACRAAASRRRRCCSTRGTSRVAGALPGRRRSARQPKLSVPALASSCFSCGGGGGTSPKKSSPSLCVAAVEGVLGRSGAKPPLHEVAVEGEQQASTQAAALGHDDTAGALRRFREARGGGGASRPLLGKRCRVVEALGRPGAKDHLGHAFEWDDEASRYRVRLDSRLMYAPRSNATAAAPRRRTAGRRPRRRRWRSAPTSSSPRRPPTRRAPPTAAAPPPPAGPGARGTAAPAWQPPAIDERGRDERGVPIWNRPPAFVLEEQMRDPTVTAAVARREREWALSAWEVSFIFCRRSCAIYGQPLPT